MTPEQTALLTPEERRAWEALAAFDATGRDIVARRLTGERASAPMNRHMPGAEGHLRAALTTIANLRAERVDMLALLADLVDADDCWFDHHGGCQAHGYLSLKPGEECPHAEAKRRIATAKEPA